MLSPTNKPVPNSLVQQQEYVTDELEGDSTEVSYESRIEAIEGEISESNFKDKRGVEKAIDIHNKITAVFEDYIYVDSALDVVRETNRLESELKSSLYDVHGDNPNYLLKKLQDHQKNHQELLSEYHKAKKEQRSLEVEFAEALVSLATPKHRNWKKNEINRRLNSQNYRLKKIENSLKNSEKNMKVNLRLLEPVLETFCIEIEENDKPQGFIYRVTNAEGTHHYLVGTLHKATDKMAQSAALDVVINDSDQLFVENKIGALSRWFQGLNKKDPFHNCIDLALYNKAKSVSSLETVSDGLNAFGGGSIWDVSSNLLSHTSSVVSTFFNNYTRLLTTEPVQNILQASISYSLTPARWTFQKTSDLLRRVIIGSPLPIEERVSIASIAKVYNVGDINALKPLPADEAVFDDRNEKWLNDDGARLGMISRLQTSKESCCYAFGAGHLVMGSPNILGELKKVDGLTIERGHYDYNSSEMSWNVIE